MNADLEFVLDLLKKEAWVHKKLVTTLYLATALLFAGLAWIWPQVYTSSATIIVDQKNIIRPLMEKTAPTTALIEPNKLATQILNSRSTLSEIIDNDDWLDENATAADRDVLIDNLRNKIKITSIGKNIIQVSFSNKDPYRAYKTTKALSETFARESLLYKQRESKSAYDFIDKQASVYHQKLLAAENAIKEFREKNIDSTPGAKEVVNERILTLTRQIEDLEIEIYGEKSKLDALESQLRGGKGVEKSASIARETTLRERVAELKSQLDDLRLTYKDTYPDIIQLKSQISSIELEIKQEIVSRNSGVRTGGNDVIDSPIAQELQGQILTSNTKISTLESRRGQLQKLLDKEREKIQRINSVELEITELTRDSAVNQSKYDELVGQRESARIAMEMDLANQGVSARIQEAAFLPASPKGIRFIHIIIAGLILSFAIPLSVVYGLAMLDQKLRDKRVILESLQLPILANVHPLKTIAQRRVGHLKMFTIAMVVASSWAVYAYEILLRIQG